MNRLIAIPLDENGDLDTHFGHCKCFALVSTRNEEIIKEENLIPPPHEPGLLPKWLAEKGVTDIIAGGIGQKAIQLLKQNKINTLIGAPKLGGNELVRRYLSNTLSFSTNNCDH